MNTYLSLPTKKCGGLQNIGTPALGDADTWWWWALQVMPMSVAGVGRVVEHRTHEGLLYICGLGPQLYPRVKLDH